MLTLKARILLNRYFNEQRQQHLTKGLLRHSLRRIESFEWFILDKFLFKTFFFLLCRILRAKQKQVTIFNKTRKKRTTWKNPTLIGQNTNDEDVQRDFFQSN